MAARSDLAWSSSDWRLLFLSRREASRSAWVSEGEWREREEMGRRVRSKREIICFILDLLLIQRKDGIPFIIEISALKRESLSLNFKFKFELLKKI